MTLRTLRTYEARAPMGLEDVSEALTGAEVCAADAATLLKKALDRMHTADMTDAAVQLASAIEQLREALEHIEPVVATALGWADAENDY